MIREGLNRRRTAVALRQWLYPERITPGHRVRCQLPGCHAVLGRSGHHLRFRSLRRSDAALPPEWVGWHCGRCGHLNVYCPDKEPGNEL